MAALSEGSDTVARGNLCGIVGNTALSRACWWSESEPVETLTRWGAAGENRTMLRRAGAAKILVACLSTDDPLVQVCVCPGCSIHDSNLQCSDDGVVRHGPCVG
jgi:hypothetical protein